MCRYIAFLFATLFLASCSPSQSPVKEKDSLGDSQQLILVSAETETSTTATLTRKEKVSGEWKQIGNTIPVTLGRSGLAWGTGLHKPQSGQQKKEGDGKSPAGIFRLTNIFGYAAPDSVNFQMPYLHANKALECVDDSNSKFYNQFVDNQAVEKDWNSSEFMRMQDHQYQWGLLVEHNAGAVPMGGSCIFLHIWKAPGASTSGCTAMKEEDMMELIGWLNIDKKPVLVQGVSSVSFVSHE